MFKARAFTGRHAPEVDGVKVLAIQVLAQAVRDARCRNPRRRHAAIDWLNSTEGQGLAQALGVKRWQGKQEITQHDIPGRVRDTWFVGGAP